MKPVSVGTLEAAIADALTDARDQVASTFETLARMAGVDADTLRAMDALEFEAACDRMARHDTEPCPPTRMT